MLSLQSDDDDFASEQSAMLLLGDEDPLDAAPSREVEWPRRTSVVEPAVSRSFDQGALIPLAERLRLPGPAQPGIPRYRLASAAQRTRLRGGKDGGRFGGHRGRIARFRRTRTPVGLRYPGAAPLAAAPAFVFLGLREARSAQCILKRVRHRRLTCRGIRRDSNAPTGPGFKMQPC